MNREILNEAGGLFSAASRTISSKTTYKIQRRGYSPWSEKCPKLARSYFPCKLGVIVMVKEIVVLLLQNICQFLPSKIIHPFLRIGRLEEVLKYRFRLAVTVVPKSSTAMRYSLDVQRYLKQS